MIPRSYLNLTTHNYSVYSLPLAFLLAQFVSPRVALHKLGLGHNVSPRDDLVTATPTSGTTKPPHGKSISVADLATLKRREGAHKNGLENFPLFVAAIIVGNDAGLGTVEMNAIAAGYLGIRCLYNYLYVTVDKEKDSHWRYSPQIRWRDITNSFLRWAD